MSRNSRTWIAVLAVAIAAGLAGYFFSGPSGDEEEKAPAQREPEETAMPKETTPPKTVKAEDLALSDDESTDAERNEDVRFPEVDAEEVPESMRMIVGLAEEKGYKARMDAVHALGRDLPPNEVDALMEFLGSRYDNLPSRQVNSVKNDIVEKLLRQKTMPPDLGTSLVGMYAEEDRDPVWRDYCIQLVSLYYDRRWEPGSEESGAEREEIRNTLWDAVDSDIESGISGTALLSLKRLSEKHPEFGEDRLREVCVNVLSSDASHPSAKTCAFQAASSLGDERVLPHARQTTVSSDRIPLRMAAIAALGRLGDESDIGRLEAIVENSSENASVRYVRKAAETAIEKIRARNSGDETAL